MLHHRAVPTATVVALVVLLLGGCGDGSRESEDESNHKDATQATGARDPAVARASWTDVEPAGAALPPHPANTLRETLPATKRLPALVSGSISPPGQGSSAVVWHPDGDELGRAIRLDVGGDSSTASDLATNGTVTAVAGTSWRAGTSSPYLLTSTDRVDWQAAALPSEMEARGLHAEDLLVLDRGRILAMGVDSKHHPTAVDVAAGTLTELPMPRGGVEAQRMTGLARIGEVLVALVSVQRDDGGSGVTSYHSKVGAAWRQGAPLAGDQATVAGVTPVGDGLLATGWTQGGTETVPAAWFTTDGVTWDREDVPALPDHHAGWDAYLGDPAGNGRFAYVGATDTEKLDNVILRRDAKGSWSILGQAPSWLAPGLFAVVEVNGDAVSVFRGYQGQVQAGRLGRAGDWATVGVTLPAAAPVAWWDSIGLDGKTPVLVGGQTEVSLLPDGRWTRFTRLSRFTVEGTKLSRAEWVPRASAGLTGVAMATSDSGAAVLLGERIFPSDVTGVTDESGLIGWYHSPGRHQWRPVTGLAGARTEFLNDLAVFGEEWVATGVDRHSFVASDHSFGAVWTSQNGRAWKRELGPFEVSRDRNSWIGGTCPLPGGGLLAVGGVEAPATGSKASTFRRTGGQWESLDSSALRGATRLDSCANLGAVTLVQGQQGDHDAIWSTDDGSTFSPVEIGTDEDEVGRIVALGSGFAAPGGVYEGNASRPVVWLSADGTDWSPVDVPVEQPMIAASALRWGHRLLVALTSESGPEVRVLDNPEALLAP